MSASEPQFDIAPDDNALASMTRDLRFLRLFLGYQRH